MHAWLAWNSYHIVQAALQLTDICLPLGVDHYAWWLVLIEKKKICISSGERCYATAERVNTVSELASEYLLAGVVN